MTQKPTQHIYQCVIRILMEATPAKWKVFSVICVPGSPILWAHTAPTAVPRINNYDM